MGSGPMLSVREVAELLGIRPHSVTALVRNKQLKAADVSLTPGGRATWRIERSEVEAFIQRRTVSPIPPRRRKRKSTVKKFF